MAVQKNRKTRSKSAKRRTHQTYREKAKMLSVDPTSGMIHVRHNIAPDGFYRGQEVVAQSIYEEDEEE